MRFLMRTRDMIAEEGTEGRNPFEVLMLMWSVFIGATLTFTTPPPESITSSLPRWMVTLWYILLCTGGLVGLVGVWLRNLILSLLVERAGMMIVAPSAVLYSVALFSLGGRAAIALAGSTMMFAIAAGIRILRIGAQIKVMRDHLHELQGLAPEE